MAKLPDVYEAADLFAEASLHELGIATLARKVLAAAMSTGTSQE